MKTNKYCLITGASGGIGGAIAHALSNSGYTLILQGRSKEKLMSLQQALPSESSIVLGDLTKSEDRALMLTQAFAIGRIDLLINNAGISSFAPFATMAAENIEQLININLTAPMLFTQSFLQKLNLSSNVNANVNATIINVGSAFGFIGHPGFSTYCASKFGLRGFTESLARELSDSNIRVAFFAPRATQTEFNAAEVNALNHALGNHIDSPADVAHAFMSLLNGNQQRKVVGWPEKLFARINGVLPEVVDTAMASKLQQIKHYFKPDTHAPEASTPTTHSEAANVASVKYRGN